MQVQEVLMKFMLGGGIIAVMLMLAVLLKPQLEGFCCFVRRLSNRERSLFAAFLSVFIAYGGSKPSPMPTPIYEGDFRADPENVVIDKVEPTIFERVTMTFGDMAMAVGDKVALYRTADDVLCGYGEVVSFKGAMQLTLSLQVKEGTVVRFEGWQASSRRAYAMRATLGDAKDAETLAMPEPGLIVPGLALATASGGGSPPVPPIPPEPVVTNTVTYLGLEGAANPNPATFTTNDLPLVLAPLEREGYAFLGWTPDDGVIPAGTVTDVTFTATWERREDPPEPPEDEPTPLYEGEFRGDPDSVTIDKVEPTIFSGVAMTFGGVAMAVGDKVGLYRTSDGVLCGYGEAIDHKGTVQLTLSLQVKEGTLVRFEGWQASSRRAYAMRATLGDAKDVETLAMPEPGSIMPGLALVTVSGGEPPPVPPEPVVTNTVTYLGLEGAANPNPATFTTNDLPLVLAPLERKGYTFLGWTPDGGVIPAGTVTNVTFTATWEKQEDPPTPPEPPPVPPEPVVTNTVTYLGLEGAANPNPATFTTNDLPLVLAPLERKGYTFLGWTPDGGVIPAGTVTNVTFTATWEKQEDPPEPPEDEPTPLYEGEFRGDPDSVTIDKVEPTIFSGVAMTFGGVAMAVGDKVGLYRTSDGVLCGYGEAIDHKGTVQLTLSLQVKEGTLVRFEGWQASSRRAYAMRATLGDAKDVETLAMPEPGSIMPGLALVTVSGGEPPPEPPVVEPVVTNTVTYLGLEGAANPNPATFTTNDLPLVLAPLERKGYVFLGWTPDGGVISAGTVTNVTFTANWEKQEEPPTPPEPVVTNTVTYLGLEGAANPNPATFTTNDLPLALAPLEREGYAFLGWTPDGGVIPAGTVTNVTFTANWEKQEEPPTPPDERRSVVDALTEIEDVATFPATTYDGYLYDEETGDVVGTIQVKAAKAKYNKKTWKTTTKLTIGIQPVTDKKKVSISGEYDLELGGEQTFADKKGHSVTLRLGGNGLTGSFGDYAVEAVVNVFALKDAVSKEKASAAEAAYVGTYNVFAEEGAFTVSVAKKGKVKVAGTLVGGTKLSASAQLLVGEGVACAPFVVAKQGLAFSVWFGEELAVEGLTDALVGDIEDGKDVAGQNAFYVDAEALSEVMTEAGVKPLPDFMPAGVSVTSNGKKWTVADGAKAGKIKYDASSDYAWDEKSSGNPAGLTLSYSAKTGTFTGSFKAYGVVKGKLKSYTAKVTGVLVNGQGYGYATISKMGSAKVRIYSEALTVPLSPSDPAFGAGGTVVGNMAELRTALAAGASTIYLRNGQYNMQSSFDIDKSVVLIGESREDTVFKGRGGWYDAISIRSGDDEPVVTIRNCRLTWMNVEKGCRLTMDGCTLAPVGYGDSLSSRGECELTNCFLSGATYSGAGGHIVLEGVSVDSRSTPLFANGEGAAITARSCLLHSEYTSYYATAYSSATVELHGCTLSGHLKNTYADDTSTITETDE